LEEEIMWLKRAITLSTLGLVLTAGAIAKDEASAKPKSRVILDAVVARADGVIVGVTLLESGTLTAWELTKSGVKRPVQMRQIHAHDLLEVERYSRIIVRSVLRARGLEDLPHEWRFPDLGVLLRCGGGVRSPVERGPDADAGTVLSALPRNKGQYETREFPRRKGDDTDAGTVLSALPRNKGQYDTREFPRFKGDDTDAGSILAAATPRKKGQYDTHEFPRVKGDDTDAGSILAAATPRNKGQYDTREFPRRKGIDTDAGSVLAGAAERPRWRDLIQTKRVLVSLYDSQLDRRAVLWPQRRGVEEEAVDAFRLVAKLIE
jgi:hypothetical protein